MLCLAVAVLKSCEEIIINKLKKCGGGDGDGEDIGKNKNRYLTKAMQPRSSDCNATRGS